MRTAIRPVMLLAFSLIVSVVYSQSWPGFETGRFSGISSATLRPGGMAPMPFKVDATLAGVHLNTKPSNFFGSDILDVTLSGGFYNFSGFNELRSKTHVFSNLQGPSVQVQAHERVAVAFAWNARHLWLSSFSKPEVAQLFSDDDPQSIIGENETVRVLYTGWQEFALGAAGAILEEDFHKFSAGAFVKVVLGTGHMNVNITDMHIDASPATVQHMDFSIDAAVSDNLAEVVDEGMPANTKAGYGFDIGAEYRMINLRSCPGASNFRLKAGFALNDLGRVTYSNATLYSKTTATADSIDRSAFRNSFINTTDTLQQIFEIDKAAAENLKVTLPMSLRLYFEYTIRRRAIIYSELQMVFAQMMHDDMPLMFRFNITPRFEDDRFGIYVPLTFTNYTPVEAGLAFRLKPLVIGSGNLLTFMAFEERGKALDFYVALKIPILNGDERIDWKVMGPRSRKRL